MSALQNQLVEKQALEEEVKRYVVSSATYMRTTALCCCLFECVVLASECNCGDGGGQCNQA